MTKATAERLGADWTEFSFLVSDGAGFVSGQVLDVAGGPKA